MTYPLGSIILIKDYQLPTEKKDKFFIIIEKNDDDYNLLTMTTSQFHFSPDIIKHGVINKDEGAAMYCFERGRVIGVNGFSFRKHTFVNHNSNIHQFSFEQLNHYTVEVMDTLIKKELEDLIYSFYQYKGTPRKYKAVLESILEKICK